MATKNLTNIEKFPKHSLLELAGILSNKEADELRRHIKEIRMESRKRIKKIITFISYGKFLRTQREAQSMQP